MYVCLCARYAGSCIKLAVDDAQAIYEEVFSRGKELRLLALHALQKMLFPTLNGTNGLKQMRSDEQKSHTYLLVNTLSSPRTECVLFPESTYNMVSVPAMGYCVHTFTPTLPISSPYATLVASEGGYTMENVYIRVKVRANGTVASVFHKGLQRECLAEGEVGNRFVMFEDIPLYWDAWDVEVYHMQTRRDVSTSTAQGTPSGTITRATEGKSVMVAVECTFTLSSKATIRQIIRLSALASYVEFDTTIDWHESHRMLKVEFPLAVHSPQATFEVQYGHIARNTHYNTTHDIAKFEVCAQRWADLSEYGFGVALLNDCKYGYSVQRNVLALSLLRSPKKPDKEADMGTHHLRYALFPHAGSSTLYMILSIVGETVF